MNTTIVYRVHDCQKGVIDCSCTSLCQAMAACQRLKNPDVAMIIPVLNDPITTTFYTMDELIADMARNHSKRYSVVEWTDDWSGDGPYENDPFTATLADLVRYLVTHADRYELLTYVFDPTTRTGSYRLTSGIGDAEACGLRLDEMSV